MFVISIDVLINKIKKFSFDWYWNFSFCISKIKINGKNDHI